MTATDSLYFNTVNPHKIEEIKLIFRDSKRPIAFLHHQVVEIISVELEEIIRRKAAAAYEAHRVPVIVEHGGLFIEHLKGFPGALSKPMWDMLDTMICDLLPRGVSRKAWAGSAVCYCDGRHRLVHVEKVEGEIAEAKRGIHGFQWDPIFIPKGESRTFGEMDTAEKLKHSQAAKAYRELRRQLAV